ncbi:MAG TPA: 6-phosphofructokinase [Candidatus Thermoplasmatota archaeon]|nr:6-phosphofructokinase [Candidatus Thermoplasmatota archaeon]
MSPEPNESRKSRNGTPVLAILVGGGPAPGINGVISATTLEANKAGYRVLGVRNGFRGLLNPAGPQVEELTYQNVGRIYTEGGSVLGTARESPRRDPQKLAKVMQALRDLHVSALVTIGGEGTLASAAAVSDQGRGWLRVAHVPKTIDNDLPLPPHLPTFGFQTARHEGTRIVENLKMDARTTDRWYLVTTMGREAGHLALGIGKAAAATVTLIPEEFPGRRTSVREVVDILECAILKRRALGREHGVAVLAEGLVEILEGLEAIPDSGLAFDEYGRKKVSEVRLGLILKRELQKRLQARGITTPIVTKELGYELRCAPPTPFDMEYTRDLGYGAARFVTEGGTGAVIAVDAGRIIPIPFDSLVDRPTGRTRVRYVDTTTTAFQVAWEYMCRLKPEDLQDRALWAALAVQAGMTPEAFAVRYGYLATPRSPPLQVIQ